MTLPKRRALSDLDIIKYAESFGISHFRGVFSRDKLPVKPKIYESAVVNLDIDRGKGTHWVAYFKKSKDVVYFDSFGNLPPPLELEKYFTGLRVKYNYNQKQKYNTNVCGQLCLKFLKSQCSNR